MNEEILGLKLKGYCCSQIIMEMGLTRLEKENGDLIAAMAGLCDGIWKGRTCGILSAAICLLYLADAHGAAKTHVDELNEWFEDAFETVECAELVGDNPLNKVAKCPMMLEATFNKVSEMLEWD